MKNLGFYITRAALCLFIFSACAEYKTHRIVSTSVMQAQETIPEEELIDVGIAVFETEELIEENAKEEGTHEDIRKAERHFMPYHLKNTLQQSSYWGAVRVIPEQEKSLDLTVKGEIVESNGERLTLKVDVCDAAGNVWLRKKYKAKASEECYQNNDAGSKDVFQDMYNTIANDMAEFKNELSSNEIQKIQTVSKLKLAEDYAPDAFSDYLIVDEDGIATINRLPVDKDPLLELIVKIRQRELMFIDTLNIHYEGFYLNMWPEYENWRRANRTEMIELRKAERKAILKKAGGIVLVSLGFVLGMGVVPLASAFTEPLLFTGSNSIIQGVDIERQSEIHAAALEELRQTFGYELKPVVVDFEGKQYELTGTANEQYAKWRNLLRKRYYAETGFVSAEAMAEEPGFTLKESEAGPETSHPVNEEPEVEKELYIIKEQDTVSETSHAVDKEPAAEKELNIIIKERGAVSETSHAVNEEPDALIAESNDEKIIDSKAENAYSDDFDVK